MSKHTDRLSVTRAVGYEVELERAKQHAKWGTQDHPDTPKGVTNIYIHRANRWKQINDNRVEFDNVAWDGILLEEVYEAVSETDQAKLREELIQVAAVAVAWVEAIDRRKSDG